MTTLEVTFSLDNDSFSDEAGGDRDFAIAGVFKKLIERLISGHLNLDEGGAVMDVNGDHIGWIEITDGR